MMSNLLRRKKLIAPRNIRRFIDLYAKNDNWHNIDKNKNNLGYGWVHYSLIRNLQPKRVLVIGSRYGYIPALCALACRDNKKGVVDFVDAGYDCDNPNHKEHWGGVGFWNEVNPKVYFGKFGLEKYINTHVMTSREFSNKYPKRIWDYISLDGDHSYKGVKYDFKTFWLRLKKFGYVSLHDIYTKQSEGLEYGVSKYWKEIKKTNLHSIEFAGQYGLGLVQKV